MPTYTLKQLPLDPGCIPGEPEAQDDGNLCHLLQAPFLGDFDLSHSCELSTNPAMLGIYVHE